jgi:hypothetical protein
MKYNLSSSHDIAEAQRLLSQLTVDGKMVEIKEIKPRRSLSQNSYLHVLLGAFGSNLGYTTEESKELYKRLPGNKELYVYTKDVGGKPMEFTRSSADLNKDEMTKSIETLREWSAKMGYPLPTADNVEELRRLENYIETHERYL